MDFEALIQSVRRIQRPELWLTRTGLIAAPAFAFLVALAILPLIEFPNQVLQTVIRFIGLLTLPLAAISVWFTATQYYLRSGDGIKFGLVDNISIGDMRKWDDTRDALQDLFKSRKTAGRISLRLVPPTKVRNENSLMRLLGKYKFTLLIQCESRPDGSPLFKILNRGELENEFARNTLNHINTLCHVRKERLCNDLIPQNARNLYDGILFISAALYFARGKFEDASAILEILDMQLAREMSPKDHPRQQVRWLDAMCLMAPCKFNMSKGLPPKEQFDAALESAERGLKYGDDDPGVYFVAARMHFLAGNIDRADELAKKAEEYSLPELELVACIDRAFLSCLKGEWSTSYEKFIQLFAMPEYRDLDWGDLVSFADYAAEIGYDPARYIQVLYRKVARMQVPADMLNYAREWAASDRSRAGLGALLERRFARQDVTGSSKKRQGKRKGGRRKKRRKTG